MSRKQQSSRRTRPSPASRLRPFWLLVIVAIGLVAAGVYLALTLPITRPHTIVIRGNSVVSRGEILDRAAVDLETSIWIQNTRTMEQRIEAIPYVATAAVHRQPPGTISIDVTERTPYAVVVTASGAALVDRDLRVLEVGAGSSTALPVFVSDSSMPVATGVFLNASSLLALRDDNERLTAGGVVATRLDHDRFGDLEISLQNGIRVLFGDESNLEKNIPLVNPILHQIVRAGRPVTAIDLRAPDTPVLVYKK